MERIVTAKQMKKSDLYTITDMGIPAPVLMERAALAVAEEVVSGRYATGRILVVCGTGNNGGDGAAVARILKARGYSAEMFCPGQKAKFSEGRTLQQKIAENYGVPEVKNPMFGEYTVIIDAIFGIGLSRPVTGDFAEVVERINESKVPVIAVDIPSGIHTDTGEVLGVGVRADTTVTFACAKPGLILYPGAEYAGRVLVRDIGILPCAGTGHEPWYGAVETEDLKRLLYRNPRGNKGTFGKVLAVAGSDEMCGAAILCARAVLESGAGMVKVFTEQSNRTPLLAAFPEAMVSLWKKGEEIPTKRLEQDLIWADAVIAGPGLGQSAEAEEILERILTDTDKPVIADADALNLISRRPALMERAGNRCIFTPHVGEAARLLNSTVGELQKDPVRAARQIAKEYGVSCVLKDAVTVIAPEKENTIYLNRSGCSALATAGSGDVLSGVLGALAAKMVCEGSFQAGWCAAAGVYLHGLAGEAAASRWGEAPVTASRVAEALSMVLRTVGK